MSDFNQNKSIYIKAVIILCAAILLVRLLFLQVIGSGGYKEASKNQAVIRKVVHPARGLLLDRNKKIILNNIISYDLAIQPKVLRKNFDTAFLCKLINIPIEDFRKTAEEVILRNGWHRNSTFYKGLSAEAVARLQENIQAFAGVDLIERTERNFPEDCGGNFIGFTNEINKEMLEMEKYRSYRRGDIVGITGLENVYEQVLRGKPGITYLLQDVKQRIIGSYQNGELDSVSVAGENLDLYLDVELQKLTEKLMDKKLGSAIAIEPSTGGILAYACGPSFSPKVFTGNDKGKKLTEMYRDATKPLFNRGIMARYSPGSTFKPITALVALDEKVISASYGYPCGGAYTKCGRRIKCTHAGGGHARNMKFAIANSCNSYFCHIFRLSIDAPQYKSVKVGLKRWEKYMSDFGLGHPIGIDIPSERGGNIPDAEYYTRMYGDQWNSCSMSILGMGQGEVLLTPLQMANAMCIIANKGYYYIPHFVKSIGGDSTHALLKKYIDKHIVARIADSNFDAVIEGMKAVVDQGTARVARIKDVAVCGKTGTVENYRLINGKKVKLKNHSMFVAFAPKDSPKIAVAVCVENSGYGSQWAAPIASLMIEQYLKDTISTRKGLVHKISSANTIPRITYILDSIEKKILAEKWKEHLRRQDSIKRAERKMDSIQKAGKKVKNERKGLFGLYIKKEEYFEYI